ncbi:hypothetical protein [Dokdonella sp.]|uniref:hypothetical protein n=2 Tax=Dokdonella sp. TaxID=2291710 RepID=UPI00321FF036
MNDCSLLPIGADSLPMEVEVLGWFAAGHDVLWIPIVEVGDGPDAIARAQAQADALGKPYLLESVEEFARLPDGVRGWVFPAHQDDTCIVATRNGGEVTFGVLRHPVTGEAIRYRTDTETAVGLTPPLAA